MVKQYVDAEWGILTLQPVQTWLMNSAIGAEFMQMLTAAEDASELGAKDNLRLQALKSVVFAALAGNPAATEYLEQKTGRSVAFGPDTQAHLTSMIPVYVFIDRAITTRMARRDAAYRDLRRLKAERAVRMAGKNLPLEDLRSELSLSDYMRLSGEIDLMKQYEPVMYVEQLVRAVKKLVDPAQFAAVEKAVTERISDEASTESEQIAHAPNQTKQAAPAPAASAETGTIDPVSVHAPVQTAPLPTGEQSVQEFADAVSVHVPDETIAAPLQSDDVQDDVAGKN